MERFTGKAHKNVTLVPIIDDILDTRAKKARVKDELGESKGSQY